MVQDLICLPMLFWVIQELFKRFVFRFRDPDSVFMICRLFRFRDPDSVLVICTLFRFGDPDSVFVIPKSFWESKCSSYYSSTVLGFQTCVTDPVTILLIRGLFQ